MLENGNAHQESVADSVKYTVMMNMAPSHPKTNLHLGTSANSAALRNALLQWWTDVTLPKSDFGQNCCSSAQRPLFSLCSFPFHLALAFALLETTVGAVICISTRFPPVFRPMSRCATVVTCVCVHNPRAREFRLLTFFLCPYSCPF